MTKLMKLQQFLRTHPNFNLFAIQCKTQEYASEFIVLAYQLGFKFDKNDTDVPRDKDGQVLTKWKINKSTTCYALGFIGDEKIIYRAKVKFYENLGKEIYDYADIVDGADEDTVPEETKNMPQAEFNVKPNINQTQQPYQYQPQQPIPIPSNPVQPVLTQNSVKPAVSEYNTHNSEQKQPVIHKIPKFCSNCGAKLNKRAKFCPECGTKVEQEEIKAPEEPQHVPSPAVRQNEPVVQIKPAEPAAPIVPAPETEPLVINPIKTEPFEVNVPETFQAETKEKTMPQNTEIPSEKEIKEEPQEAEPVNNNDYPPVCKYFNVEPFQTFSIKNEELFAGRRQYRFNGKGMREIKVGPDEWFTADNEQELTYLFNHPDQVVVKK